MTIDQVQVSNRGFEDSLNLEINIKLLQTKIKTIILSWYRHNLSDSYNYYAGYLINANNGSAKKKFRFTFPVFYCEQKLIASIKNTEGAEDCVG